MTGNEPAQVVACVSDEVEPAAAPAATQGRTAGNPVFKDGDGMDPKVGEREDSQIVGGGALGFCVSGVFRAILPFIMCYQGLPQWADLAFVKRVRLA
jgi:hypothetical protein